LGRSLLLATGYQSSRFTDIFKSSFFMKRQV
jgi:hypothetical protein